MKNLLVKIANNKKVAIGLTCLVVLIFLYLKGPDEASRKMFRLKNGMSCNEVVNVMGLPQSIGHENYDDSLSFSYMYPNHAFASSDDFYIFFSKKDSLVKRIYWGN